MAVDSLKVLVVTGGHPFEREPFLAIFDALPGIVWQHDQPPEARDHFRPDKVGEFDAIVCYDMQGIVFNKPNLPELLTPPPQYAQAFSQMLEAGQGIVFLHHAMSAWPTWPLWAEVVGGRWNYVPSELNGTIWPASGYTREVEHHISCIDPSHPICAGIEDGFDIVDEIYLNPVLEDRIVPLLRTNFDTSPESFYSGQHAIQGRLYEREGWTHPPGSGLVGWVKTAGRSPIAYLQSGHGPAAYGNVGFRQVLSNAIAWVSSEEAHRWAAAHETALAG
ncbi:MAG TPA: ThuA domain-containing protein [Acidimicrobiales bacterium]|nr:ThuA domain-containing protein [Acidimicrobiales bacterium]